MTQFPVMPIRITPFEEPKSYQMPQYAVSMLIERELTRAGAMDLLFSPESLTLKERDTFVTRMKEQAGGGAFTNALIDIATNPFVWLMFVTSPAAVGALAKGGQSLFHTASKYSPFVMKNAPFLQAIGMAPAMQMYNNTAITPALMQVTKGIGRMDEEMSKLVAPQLDKVLRHNKINNLDPRYVSDPVGKAVAERVNDALSAKLGGYDTAWREWKTRLKPTRTGKRLDDIDVQIVPIDHHRMVTANLDQILAEHGATGLYQSIRQAMDQRWVRIWGHDEIYRKSRLFLLDDDKVKRIYRGIRHNQVTAGTAALDSGVVGASQIGSLMGPHMSEALISGRISEQKFLEIMRTVAGGARGEFRAKHYMPENMLDLVGGVGVDEHVLRSVREGSRFMTTGAAIPKRISGTPHHPDDLRRLAASFGATPAMRSKIAEMDTMIGKARTEPIHVFRINAFESMRRYFRDTGETYALYVQRLADSPGTRAARAEYNKYIEPGRIMAYEASVARQKGAGQWGGTSMADVLQEQYVGMTSKHAQRSLTDIVVPRLLERAEHRTLPHLASYAALLKGKEGIAGALDAGLGRVMDAGGSWGKRAHAKLRQLADPDIPMQAGRSATANAARYLYVTHLGMNLSSVVLNLTQPFLLASTWLGVRNVMKGYKTAFKEFGGYIRERQRLGWRALPDAQQTALIRNHFKHSNFDGEDLLNIGKGAFANLDDVTYRTSGLTRAGQKSLADEGFDKSMKLFEKAEWLNRSVTGHAVEEAYKAAGRFPKAGDVLGRATMKQDIMRMVGETQFGGTVLNTPLAMLGGGPFGMILNNPIMRQFLSFPIRSFTGVVSLGPKLRGRKFFGRDVGDGYFRNLALDSMRGLGISAIIYELGKNFVGADLSRGLYSQAATDILGGERFLEDGNEWIPIPPAVDIPMNLIKAFATEDLALMQQTIPRLFPGGIAFSRAMGVLPRLPDTFMAGLPASLQKTYVGWDMVQPDGTVPMFSADGRIIDFRSGSEIILKGLGADLNRWQSPGELDNYLVKQRDEIVNARREAIRLYLSNDVQKAEAVRREFQKRHGFPLTITRDQIRQAIRLRTTPRPERILDRMPTEARHLYQQLAAVSGVPQRAQLPASAITDAQTARQRDQLRKAHTLLLDPETVKKLQALAQLQEAQAKAGKSFIGYAADKGPVNIGTPNPTPNP